MVVSYDTKEAAMSPANPTAKTYAALNRAFDFFNDRLFGGELPPCLVTLQRKNKAYGYFAGGRFGSKDGAEITDEIALNPSHFKSRTDEQSLSTLAHEMSPLAAPFREALAEWLPQQGMGGEDARDPQPDFSALYVELWDDADARKKRKAKSASKTRYTCPSCELHAWAKPGARLVCGQCDEPMAAEDGDDD